MGNSEYTSIMREVYKFLRDKIIISYGDYLSDEVKQNFYSFDPENILVSSDYKRIVEYSRNDNKFYIREGFLTPQYVERLINKNPGLTIENVRSKVDNEDCKTLLEEFIIFSVDLGIKERDIVKSLFTQEILKMILLTGKEDAREETVTIGIIELLAHELGNREGFLVSTPKKILGELEVAISLKEKLGSNFESTVIGRSVNSYLDQIEDYNLKAKIEALANDRKVIESTQNLDSVVNSINEIVEEVTQVSIIDGVVKFLDENDEVSIIDGYDPNEVVDMYHEIKKTKGDKEKVSKAELMNRLDFMKSEIISIEEDVHEEPTVEESHDKTINILKDEIKTAVNSYNEASKEDLNELEFNEISEKFRNDSNSLTESELLYMNKYIENKTAANNEQIQISNTGKSKIIKMVVILVLTVIIGIVLGWLLFKLK